MIHIHMSISQNFNGNALEHTRYDIYTPIRKRIPLPPGVPRHTHTRHVNDLSVVFTR